MTDNSYFKNNTHHKPQNFQGRFAYRLVKFMRFFADAFFAKRYGHRAVVLETVAAVPGMVGGMMLHLKSLRRMEDDHGWIHTLLAEAENERMHLMTFVKIAKPTKLERFLVLMVQVIFYVMYLILYMVSAKTAHRVVGYLEEEAVHSYTEYLQRIDDGEVENIAAPKIAKDYWGLPEDATLRDVVVVIRADEMTHREVNHCIADKLENKACDIHLAEEMSPDAQDELRVCESREAP
tara:strand:+ start:267168 stop:267875 length:708 start_codon:yes stop_codon:yes gene_type:complete